MHNERSRVVTFRLDHAALEVLEWEARYTGIPLRTTIRAILEQRAEEISVSFRTMRYTPLGSNHEEVTNGD